jgi:exodeoxyribonuclease-3
MKITTWNVNSINVRLQHVLDWMAEHQSDVLCLQETKMTDDKFPAEAIEAAGYQVSFAGQKTYNGVAILSQHPITDVVTEFPGYGDPQRRLMAATINGVRIVDVYIPNGSSVDSDKYVYKLEWLTHLQTFMEQQVAEHEHVVLLGDFNIAPADLDVHDPDAWRDDVLCSAPEREALEKLVQLGLVDVFREYTDEALYSWWDYRQAAFRRNRGLRIDLILATTEYAKQCVEVMIDKAPRKWERPSDHAPVMATFS